jgi:hypothetical protein
MAPQSHGQQEQHCDERALLKRVCALTPTSVRVCMYCIIVVPSWQIASCQPQGVAWADTAAGAAAFKHSAPQGWRVCSAGSLWLLAAHCSTGSCSSGSSSQAPATCSGGWCMMQCCHQLLICAQLSARCRRHVASCAARCCGMVVGWGISALRAVCCEAPGHQLLRHLCCCSAGCVRPTDSAALHRFGAAMRHSLHCCSYIMKSAKLVGCRRRRHWCSSATEPQVPAHTCCLAQLCWCSSAMQPQLCWCSRLGPCQGAGM